MTEISVKYTVLGVADKNSDTSEAVCIQAQPPTIPGNGNGGRGIKITLILNPQFPGSMR